MVKPTFLTLSLFCAYSVLFAAFSVASADNICNQEETTKCDVYETCCPFSDGNFGCCPYPYANCCPDTNACCQSGFQCEPNGNACVRMTVPQ